MLVFIQSPTTSFPLTPPVNSSVVRPLKPRHRMGQEEEKRVPPCFCGKVSDSIKALFSKEFRTAQEFLEPLEQYMYLNFNKNKKLDEQKEFTSELLSNLGGKKNPFGYKPLKGDNKSEVSKKVVYLLCEMMQHHLEFCFNPKQYSDHVEECYKAEIKNSKRTLDKAQLQSIYNYIVDTQKKMDMNYKPTIALKSNQTGSDTISTIIILLRDYLLTKTNESINNGAIADSSTTDNNQVSTEDQKKRLSNELSPSIENMKPKKKQKREHLSDADKDLQIQELKQKLKQKEDEITFLRASITLLTQNFRSMINEFEKNLK